MADTHTTRPFKCSNCDRGFTRQENLKRHINTHHKGGNARSYQCTLCNARFARSDLRKRHIENCHVPSSTSPIFVETLQPISQSNGITAESPTTSAWLDMLMAPPEITVSDVPPDRESGHQQPNSHGPMQVNFLPKKDPLLTGYRISSETQCIESFFSSFHCNFPVLHEASFHVISAPTPLLNAITCIGSLYCQSTYNEISRKALFESTLTSLQKYVEQNRSRYQEIWVFQTFLLLEFLGIYGGDDGNFLKAERIHRDLVSATRMLQMSHDVGSIYSTDDSGNEAEEEDEYNKDMDESMPLDTRWQGFIKRESKKRCIYTLYLLDSQFSILCNLRPVLSSLEIKYDLPCCEDLWLAKTAEEWQTCQKSQNPPAHGYFYEASQTLLHSDREKRKPRKLRLLWASPFAAVILVTQLQMMARELTHASCLLERPKARRRTLSLLTDTQHAQISQALKGIADLVPRQRRPVFDLFDFRRMDTLLEPQDQAPLWHTFWILWHYTSLTLSHPDSLLVSGVVECSLPLAIATAGHLATPRSKEKRDIYEDRDVFRIMNDLEVALEILNLTKSTTSPTIENPFITLLGFKICLVAWRLVRLTMCNAGESTERGGRLNPCKFVLDGIMSCVDNGQDSLMLDRQITGVRDTARTEVQFLEWIVESFKKRTSWPVGDWVSTVMEESLAKAEGAYDALRRQ
ncbi:fungal-specific transcription factor domain-containing protein [Tricladium varicosporioides]|nr:fungal-specific transcription factor domain-containing protein [Hymenoscyphus varicosporioides]